MDNFFYAFIYDICTEYFRSTFYDIVTYLIREGMPCGVSVLQARQSEFETRHCVHLRSPYSLLYSDFQPIHFNFRALIDNLQILLSPSP